ncbi:transglutaminaseTgpA domain-containing protein [Cohnella yongneupensis]|uniref:TransglutaminaseTgpA domain-containing protein n=1 Tax=Cohnella yongneupensis TaxID=425006 RepID=A0ABW0R6W0_9BACL
MRINRTSLFLQRLVLERLHRVLAIIIVLQLIQCFTDLWWEETFSIIYGTLAVTAVTELLFTRGFLWRFIVQLVAALVFISYKAPVEWGGWPYSWRDGGAIKDFITYHADQLHPFYEITLGTLLVVHLMAWIGRNRAGTISILMASIITMAAVDSYYWLQLWHNIAWIIAAGLVWLVVVHLRQLQARHPDSWENLAERPFDLIVPAVLIIGVVLVMGIIMPRVPVLLEDPYTIFMEANGHKVANAGGEGGVLITSPSVSSSKGSSLSGYSRDDKEIGGGFQFDYSPIMTVTTSQRSYWRGETKAVYTGKGWGDRKNPTLLPYDYGKDTALTLSPELPKNVATKEVVQTVNVLRKDKIPVLFAAGPAFKVSELTSGGKTDLLWNPEEWELKLSKPTRIESYTVVSEVPVLDEDALRQLPPAQDSLQDLAPYLQLPVSLPERVRDLAKAQTAGLTNDYDRAKQLETYLRATYPYTNTPDVSKQTSKDVVDAFLFEIQEGYCDYFSTSFVVMARSIGLPARWVKGYSTGFDPAELERQRFGFDESQDPSGAGTYTVRNADAHSWAEVYFEGYGWIPFEPTSGFSLPLPRPAGAVDDTDLSTPANADPVTETNTDKEQNWIVPAVASTGGALILGGLLYLFLRRRNGSVGLLWRRLRFYGSTPDQRVVREMEKLVVFLHRRGLRRDAHETMRESFLRWGGKFGSLRNDFDSAVNHFEQARYGQTRGNEQRLQAFNDAASNIRKAL